MANSTSTLHGKDGAIYLGAARGSAGSVKVSAKTSWTLQRNRDYVDVTSYGDVNKTYVAGLPNVQGTYSGFYSSDGDLLLQAATSGVTQVYLYADDSTNGGTLRLVANGPAFFDSTITQANNDAVKVNGEFRASGAWTITG